MEKMKNNRGFTLIEVIIVVAIIAIFASSVAAGANGIRLANFKKAAGKIYNEINECRSINMSHSKPVYTYIYNNGGSIYLLTDTIATHTAITLASSGGQKISSDKVKVSRIQPGGTGYDELADGEFIEISFHLNGSFRKSDGKGGQTAYYEGIKVEREGSSVNKEITMTQLTGKTYME